MSEQERKRLDLSFKPHSDKCETELTQLRTDLADARRIISELEAAQGIAGIELKRLRELAKARLRTIKHLNSKVKSLDSQLTAAIEAEHRARWPGEYA